MIGKKKPSLAAEIANAPMEKPSPKEIRIREAKNGWTVTRSGGKLGYSGTDHVYNDMDGVSKCVADFFGAKSEEAAEGE